MTKLTLFTMLCLVLAAATSAQAITLRRPYDGPIAFDITNREASITYNTTAPGVYGPGGDFALPESGPLVNDLLNPDPNNPNEDAWGLFRVNTIFSAEVNSPHVSILEDDTDILWQDGDNGEELVGIFWGMQDLGYSQAVDGTQTIETTGLQLMLIEQPKDTFAGYGGFAQGTGGRLPAISPSTYVGIGVDAAGAALPGASVWVTGESVPGFDGTMFTGSTNDVNTEFAGSFNPAAAVGTFAGNANFSWEVTGGLVEQGLGGIGRIHLEPDAAPPNNTGWFWGGDFNGDGVPDTYADFDAEFVTDANNTLNVPGFSGGAASAADWTITSSDINTAYTVPEPMTVCAIGMGIAGLAGYVRKRRMA